MESEERYASSSTSSSSSMAIGFLIVFGTNGCLPSGNRGRKRSSYPIGPRKEPNGQKISRNKDISSISEGACADQPYSIKFTLPDNGENIMICEPDPSTDMFQMGRGADKTNDFVMIDPITPSNADRKMKSSAISRYACRVILNRETLETRVFAGGFNESHKMVISSKALSWKTEDDGCDGLTTNGVFLLHLKGDFMGGDATPQLWREVSVGGDLHTLRELRSAPQRGQKVDESNQLMDGSMIDLCGITLLWRTQESMNRAPRSEQFKRMLNFLSDTKAICPVTRHLLIWHDGSRLPPPSQTPHVYLGCGHVTGRTCWGNPGDELNCPVCRKSGTFAALALGMESAFWVDQEPPNHAFNPCGHMASERTIKYWAKIPLPRGKNGFIAACPFCASPLVDYPGYAKLIVASPPKDGSN